jgi:hypothetical protein
MRGERFVYGPIASVALDINVRKNEELSHPIPLCRPGGYSGELPPDPIPNSVVKVPSADGTTS